MSLKGRPSEHVSTPRQRIERAGTEPLPPEIVREMNDAVAEAVDRDRLDAEMKLTSDLVHKIAEVDGHVADVSSATRAMAVLLKLLVDATKKYTKRRCEHLPPVDDSRFFITVPAFVSLGHGVATCMPCWGALPALRLIPERARLCDLCERPERTFYPRAIQAGMVVISADVCADCAHGYDIAAGLNLIENDPAYYEQQHEGEPPRRRHRVTPDAVMAVPTCDICGTRERRLEVDGVAYCKRCAREHDVMPHGKIE